MGASSTQVTVVEYSSYNITEAGKQKVVGTFDVKSKAWDSSLGGHAFDLRLMEILATRFNENIGDGVDVRNYLRPMNKLRTQAKKVKEVLSANPNIPVIIEALYDDKDLRTHMSREEFEQTCADLFARVTGPVEQALAFANMTKEHIDTIELIGGSVRIPRLQVSILGPLSTNC
jgi:hypoxia up-regulated 1